MKSMAQSIIIGLVALVVSSCGVPIWGNRVIVDRTVEIDAKVTELISSGTANVVVVPSNIAKVVIRADENLQQYFTAKATGDILEIEEQSFVWLMPSQTVAITVFAPPLALVETSGTGDVSIEGGAASFKLVASGTGDVSFSGIVDRLDADFSGTGNFTPSGGADRLDLRASGTGDVMADGFPVRIANVMISGVGNCTLRASELISGAVSGIGNLSWTGSASCTVTQTGLGSIIKY